MLKPIIGIVGRIDFSFKEKIFLYDEYRQAIINSGGIPFLILPTYLENMKKKEPFCENLSHHEKKDLTKVLSLCDGFLFPGGSKWYGFDQFIYEYALRYDKPTLGICLGMQLMANAPFFQEDFTDKTIPIVSNINHQQDVKYVHEIHLLDSKLKDIMKSSTILVNSRHSSCVLENNSFAISSYAGDGVIESIEIPNKKFMIGVQWHPESILNDVYSQRLFHAFIESCIS